MGAGKGGTYSQFGSNGNSNHNRSNSRRRKFGMLVILIFGAAILGVMLLHKLKERRIFSLLVREKDDQLVTLELLLKRERELNKEADKKIQELKSQVYSLGTKKINLDSKLLELQSTISSLRDEHKVLESSLEEKKNEIKMLKERDIANYTAEHPLVSDHQEKTTDPVLSLSIDAAAAANSSVNSTATTGEGSVQTTGDDSKNSDGDKSETNNNGDENNVNQHAKAVKPDGEVTDVKEGDKRTEESEKELDSTSAKKMQNNGNTNRNKRKKWRELMRSRRLANRRNYVINGGDLSSDGLPKTGKDNEIQQKLIANNNAVSSSENETGATAFQEPPSKTEKDDIANHDSNETNTSQEKKIKLSDNETPGHTTDQTTTEPDEPEDQFKLQAETASQADKAKSATTVAHDASKQNNVKDDRPPEGTGTSDDKANSKVEQVINRYEETEDSSASDHHEPEAEGTDHSTAVDSDATERIAEKTEEKSENNKSQ